MYRPMPCPAALVVIPGWKMLSWLLKGIMGPVLATAKRKERRSSVRVRVKLRWEASTSCRASMALSSRLDSTLHISHPGMGRSFQADWMFSVTGMPAFSQAASFTCSRALMAGLAVFITRLTAVMLP